MRKYSWSKRYPVSAEVVGGIVESLPEKNEAALLKVARNKNSPIHHLFEWDESRAAQEYRLLQARVMLSSLHVEVITHRRDPVVVKAFIKEAATTGNYVGLYEATDADISAEEMKCLRQAKRFKAEWSHLALVRNVIEEIRAVEVKVARKRKKSG